MKWLVLALAAACTSRSPPREAAVASEGISIAIYASAERSYGVVDDRRWIEVADNTVLLDRIDPAAALQSLVIEPLGAEPLRVESCVRERVDDTPTGLASLARAGGERPQRVILSPIVRCRVEARAGTHLVRILHVTALAYATQLELAMTDAARARVTTRFAIPTPSWRGARARVALFDGVPGDKTPPRELARGTAVLDGSTAIFAGTAQDHAARLRSIYDGAQIDDPDVRPSDIVWGHRSRRQVWVWLELTTMTPLPPGRVHAHVALPDQPARDIDIAADLARRTRDTVGWPLWIDEDLLGSRRRTNAHADGVLVTDRVVISVSNLGEQTREVWIEERLRPARHRSLSHAWPTRPTITNDVARTKLTLAPGKTRRLGFTVDYKF